MKDLFYNRRKFDGNPDFNRVWVPSDSVAGNNEAISKIRSGRTSFAGVEVVGEGVLGVLTVSRWGAIHDEFDFDAAGLSPIDFDWDTMFQSVAHRLCLSTKGKIGKIGELRKGEIIFTPIGDEYPELLGPQFNAIFMKNGVVLRNDKYF